MVGFPWSPEASPLCEALHATLLFGVLRHP